MSELDNLYSRQSSYRRQKRQYESERAVVQAKINRLKTAKTQVKNIKDDKVEPAKTYITNKLGVHSDTWAGNAYNSVYEIHEFGINMSYQTYYENVDYILDSICDEITRLENENRNLGFLLNGVINALNSIGNEIEKWLN